MRVLSCSRREELESAWQSIAVKPSYDWLRRPEIGAVMVQGRAGGTGRRFNLGEMTVTRCAVRLRDQAVIGYGYVAGRDSRHAELAALFDALLQRASGDQNGPLAAIVSRLQAARESRRREQGRKAAATRATFFNLVRGDE